MLGDYLPTSYWKPHSSSIVWTSTKWLPDSCWRSEAVFLYGMLCSSMYTRKCQALFTYKNILSKTDKRHKMFRSNIYQNYICQFQLIDAILTLCEICHNNILQMENIFDTSYLCQFHLSDAIITLWWICPTEGSNCSYPITVYEKLKQLWLAMRIY